MVSNSHDWREFQMYLSTYLVDGSPPARKKLDELLTTGYRQQIRRKQKALALCEQLRPMYGELEPHVRPIEQHDFFVNFWRVELNYNVNGKLNEMPLMALAVKHGVNIDLVRPFARNTRKLALKIYSSNKPRFADKTKGRQ